MNAIPVRQTTRYRQQFYQEIEKNLVLREQLKAATDPESLYQLVIKLAQEFGYRLSYKQVQAALEPAPMSEESLSYSPENGTICVC